MNYCYLHVGAPKTGTSAIQQSLFANKELLSQNGFIYPDYGQKSDFSGIPDGNARILLRAISKNDMDEANAINRRLSMALKRYNVILSAEDLFNRAYVNGFEIIQRIFSGLNVKIVIFVRNQVDIFESAMKQRVRNHGKTNYSIPNEYFSRFNWYDFASMWSENFGKENVLIRSYEEGRGIGSEKIFYSILGLSEIIPKLNEVDKANNETLSSVTIETLRVLNKSDLPALEQKRLRELIINSRFKCDSSIVWNLPMQDVLLIKERFKESNNKLNMEYGINIKCSTRVRANYQPIKLCEEACKMLFLVINEKINQKTTIDTDFSK